MKRVACMVSASLFLVVFSSYVKAEDAVQQQEVSGGMTGSNEGAMKQHEGAGKCDRMKDSGKMMRMMNVMMPKNMVATQDGGIIVLVGNKLQKYDKDLVLQKEVQLQIDMKEIQPMMPQEITHGSMKQEQGAQAQESIQDAQEKL